MKLNGKFSFIIVFTIIQSCVLSIFSITNVKRIQQLKDYQNAEIGQEVGLKVDFYEIHLMKVEDEAQPAEIRKIREEGRRLAEAIEEDAK